MSLKERIQAAAQAAEQGRKPVEAKATLFGEKVWIRLLRNAERDYFESRLRKEFKDDSQEGILRAAFLCIALCDEAGAAIFDDSDVAWMAQRHVVDTEAVFREAQDVNRINEDSRKNSETTAGSSSSTS